MASITETSIKVDVRPYPKLEGGLGEKANVKVYYTLNLDTAEACKKVTVECKLVEDEDRLTSQSYQHYEPQSADPIPFEHTYTKCKDYETGPGAHPDVIEFSIELYQAAHYGSWRLNWDNIRALLTVSTPETILVPTTIVVPIASAEAKAQFSY